MNYTLSNGVSIPRIGFGTWQTPDDQIAVEAVKTAFACGYRHIDAAAVYANEKSVGRGIAVGLSELGLKREDIFVTSKVWNTERGYERTLAAFDKTLSDLGLEYLDLYLIHWPAVKKQFPDSWEDLNASTWRALEKLLADGKVRSIGVSNFYEHHLQSLFARCKVKPMVNQIEYHPGFRQQSVVDFCRNEGILIEAWSPLGRGSVLTNPVMVDIAARLKVSVAQLCVAWCLQNKTLPLPKSVTPSRIAANIQVDFEIPQAQMQAIDNLPECGSSGLNADEIDF